MINNKLILITSSFSVLSLNAFTGQPKQQQNQTNVIYILADDLGIGDLGCYGQKHIKTPNIDQLAATGMQFTQHYSGCTVSAPSRCVLMTGKHTGHAYIRGNKGVKTEDGLDFDYPLADKEITVAEIMRKHGYQTACIGKWGLGGPQTEGHPNNQGFDYFFGYLGQLNAHNYYPPFLFENADKIDLNKKVYSHDLIMEKALNFIDKNASKPFFLYLTPTIPHSELVLPNQDLSKYDNPQAKAQATYAGMVNRLDAGVKQIMDMLKEKGISENTIVIFTSDNGVHQEGGYQQDAFDSNGPFRGIKRDLYEGGIRTPFIVNWPAKIKNRTVSYHVSAFWDFFPTMCDLVGERKPANVDGISYLPELKGTGKQKKHNVLYWEFHEMGGKQAILKDNWKLIKLQVNNPEKTKTELYCLNSDPAELMDVAEQYPKKIKELTAILDQQRSSSELFPFRNK